MSGQDTEQGPNERILRVEGEWNKSGIRPYKKKNPRIKKGQEKFLLTSIFLLSNLKRSNLRLSRHLKSNVLCLMFKTTTQTPSSPHPHSPIFPM